MIYLHKGSLPLLKCFEMEILKRSTVHHPSPPIFTALPVYTFSSTAFSQDKMCRVRKQGIHQVQIASVHICAQSYPYWKLCFLTTEGPRRSPFPSSFSLLKRKTKRCGIPYRIRNLYIHNLGGTIHKTKCLSNLQIFLLVIGLLVLNE
jgi:hypothetical protein